MKKRLFTVLSLAAILALLVPGGSPPIAAQGEDDQPFFVAIGNGKMYAFPISGEPHQGYSIGDGGTAAVADFDNDELCEVLAVKGSDRLLRLYESDGGTGFVETVVSHDAYPPDNFSIIYDDSAVGDFDDNGFMDFAFTGARCASGYCPPGGQGLIQLHMNHGGGHFERRSIDVSDFRGRPYEAMRGLDDGDFNEDGYQDLAAQQYWNGSNNVTHLFFGNGDGTFVDSPSFTNSNPDGTPALVSGDFNNDGHLDLIIGQDDGGDPGQTWLYVGDGNGAFTRSGPAYDTNQSVESGGNGAGAGKSDAYDFDSDGNLDVIAPAAGNEGVDAIGLLLFKGNGDGTFQRSILINDNANWSKAAAPPETEPPCRWGGGPEPTYSISGRVTDNSDNSISDVTISDSMGHTTTTDGNGNYILGGLAAGDYTITPSRSGLVFSPSSLSVSVPPNATGISFVGGPVPPPTPTPTPGPTDPPPTPEPGKPQVRKVEPCFTGAYWPSGANVDNRFTAILDWQGTTPRHVDFTLNGATSQEITSLDTVAHTYNMGTDLLYGLLRTRNTLAVTAFPESDPPSESHIQTLIGYDRPRWLPHSTLFEAIFHADCPNKPLHFRCEGSWEFPVHGQATPPSWFPFIGGQAFGLCEPKVWFKNDVSTEGSSRLEGGGEGGLDIAGQTLFGRLILGGEGSVSEGMGFQITAADLGGEIGGRIKHRWPVLDFICDAFTSGVCPLQEAEDTAIFGCLIRFVNERAKIEAELEPSARLKSRLHTESGDFTWDWLDAGGRAKIRVGMAAEVIKKLAAYAYGGGEPDFSMKLLPGPALDRITARLFAGLKLRIFRWEGTYEAGYEWYYPETQALTMGKPLQRWARTSPWHPIPRDYAVNSATYATFRANEPNQQSGGELTALDGDFSLLATEESAIATNVFPDGHPAISADGSLLLLWVHDDISKPLMQGEEIYYSAYDGVSWSTPAGVTEDNLQDFGPQIAFDRNGSAVAVWEHNKVLQSEASEFNADYTNAFEIAYALWDGNAWSTPAYLTNNDAFDHSPMLVQGNDGLLLLVWRQNRAGELLGTVTNPDTIFYALWDGMSWSTPQVLLDNADGVLSLTAARHDADTMAVVYSRDIDGDFATDGDQNLYVLTWNGGAWSAPTLITDDNIEPDNRPTFFYDQDGNPRLLWIKGDTLYALLGNLSGTPRAVVVEGSAAMLDYVAAQDSTGNLALLWQGYSEQGVDVFYSAYDETHGAFSRVEQLTYDRPLEKFVSPTFAPTGEMVMAYNKTALVTETVTVSPTLVIDNVTTFGQTDLYVLRHTFGPDLEIEATDLEIDPANPALGQIAQLRVTLRNVGDRAVANPEVGFYLDDPSAGGSPIGTAMAALTLSGGMTDSLTLEWILPTSGGPFPVYAVADPNDVVEELDETNNTAQFLISLPDLTVESVHAGYGSGQVITLTATLSNTGVVAASPGNLAFRLEDPITGTVVAMGSTTTLSAGAEVEIQTLWDATSTPTGRYEIYAVADPSDEVFEADETNNNNWAGVGILPDLALYSTVVVTGTNADGTLSVSVWVFNEGLRDANGAVLGLYDRLPKPGTEPLTSAMLTIPAREHRVTTLNLGHFSLPGFYAGVGVNGEVEDRDVSNNVILIGYVHNRIYLPVILK